MTFDIVLGPGPESEPAEQMGIAEADARWLFQQLIIAVDYCHRLGIANRDIKVRNIAVAAPQPRPLSSYHRDSVLPFLPGNLDLTQH